MQTLPACPRRFVLSASIAALLATGLVGATKSSAQVVKANNTDNLNLGSSWVGGVAPLSTDVVTWDSTVTGANSTLLGADLTWATLKITNPGGLVTIGGSNRLTLSGASGIDLGSATQDLTINSSLSVTGTTALGSRTLTLSGANSVLTGIVSGSAVGPAVALNVTGGSLLLSGANTYTGVTTIGSGALVSLSNASGLGAGGAGNETIIQSGGTLNLGGQALSTERFQIIGTGVGGVGALVNLGASNTNNGNNSITLAGNATVNAGVTLAGSFNAAGTSVAGTVGRFDTRSGSYTAGAKNLDLAGNTVTKIGAAQWGVVNADVTAGGIVINEGTVSLEGGTVLNGSGTITVNPGGKLAFWGISAAANISWPITVNGGSIGETLGSSATQSVASPITIAGSINPNFVSASNVTTLNGVISKDVSSTVTEVAKRGGQVLAFNNVANTFDVPVAIYQGTLRANYNTALPAGGVAPATPLTSTDTPLGTNSTIKIDGGTLSLRINMANDATNQRWDFGRNIVLDLAPGAMDFDRLSNTSQTDKNVVVSSLTFAAPSASNNYSIGQNQFTFTQGNTHRIELTGVTMYNDTVLTTGDFTINGNFNSSGKNSLVKTGGNSWGFIGTGTQDFNAAFNLGTTQMRVGSMFGTGVTSNTVTAGTGPIFNGPNNSVTFRSPTNIASGQTIEVFSQRTTQSTVNFEQFTSLPTNLRALGSGVIGVGNASAFGAIDLSRVGDGTFRIGSNFGGSGNGTVTGVLSSGAGGLVRVGAGGTMTLSGTNLITGSSTLDVGSDLLNGGTRTSFNNTAQTGTVLLTGANNYTGGTNVNRGSTLRFQNASIGTGAANVYGTLTAEGSSGTFIVSGGANIPVTLFGGSTLRFDSSALTTAVDTDRWQDTTSIALNASTLQLDARNNNSTTNETVGAISYAGGSTISLQRNNVGASQIVQLQTSSLTRTGTGTVEVVRSGSSGFGSTVKLLPVTAPTVTNGMVNPSLIVVDATRLQTFANFDANGILPATNTSTITTGSPAGTFNTGLSATGIFYVDFASANTTLTLGDNPTVYALKVGGGTGSTTIAQSGANTTITLRSGGLIFSGDGGTSFSTDGTRTINFAPNLVANDGTNNIEAVINTRNAFTANVSGTVTANGLTKFGAGTLNLTADNAATLSGTVSVNQGTLQIFGPTTTGNFSPAGVGSILLNGGQLNLRSNATTAVAYTLQNAGVAIAQNVPMATIDVNRGDSTSTGIALTINPAASGAGLVLNGSAGVQGQTLNLTGGNTYSLVFGNNATNSFNGNVTIHTASANLTLNNSPSISGTNPVITKSGANQLTIGANSGAASVAAGTQVLLNDGTLELRNNTVFGATAQSSLVLNRGTLNLRRDGDNVFGGTAGYPVLAAGSTTISVDRVSAGSNNVETFGKLTMNEGVTLTVNNGNGFALAFQGAQLNGSTFIASNVSAGDQNSAVRFLSGFDVSGGALIKTGSGHLHLLNANNTYDGGTYVQSGILRLRAANAAGTGTVYVNPGAALDLNAVNNLGASQAVIVRSNNTFLPMLSVNADFAHPTTNIDTSAAPVGIIGISNGTSGNYNTGVNLANYGGRWSLGGVSAGAYDPVYTAATLGIGADNLYRLGGGGTSFAMGTDSARAARTNVLTGANNVRLGFDSGNILGANATNFQFSIAGVNDYSGGSTVIHRGIVARLFSNNDGTRSGFSNSAVDVFGVLGLSGAASFSNASGNTNAVTFHPGSGLFLDSFNGAANSTGAFVAANNNNRWSDTVPIILNGAAINVVGANNVATTETVGDVTFSAGARIRSARSGTGTTTLTLANLTAAAGNGNTLQLQANSLGGTNAAGGATTVIDLIKVAGTAPTVTNGMVSSAIVNATDNTFVTYGATNGFANIVYDKSVNATYAAGSLLPTDKVDVITGALTLTDNPTVYALRTSQNINPGSGFDTVTIRGGGLIGTGGTIATNLAFNNGAANTEARIYVNGTLTINGAITADGITKFGHNGTVGSTAGTLVINVPQPNYASGWTVNSGTLQINDPQGLGQSVAGNGVRLNADLSTGGQAAMNYTQTQLTFTRDNGTPELVTFTGGPITIVNEATIRAAGANDRNLQIPNVILDSSSTASSVAFTFDVPNNRFRATIPTLTLQDDAIIRVLDSGSTADTGRITAGVVNSLVGANKNLTKIGNRTLELAGDNSGTFTGGSITVSQGTVRVLNNGSLGSATTNATIERNATLEIGKSNFVSTATVNQLAGSIERWNVEDARPSSYNLPAGVNLQLNTNLIAARTIGLNGGTIEGFLYSDHVAPADLRTVSSAVTINLLANSFVGQNILQGQGYDAGRLPTVAQPFGDNVTGAFLRIDGNVTGGFNLTKTGQDTVTLAGTANAYNDTIVDMGILRIGGNDVLPTGKTLTTRLGGIFDLFGNNQTVGGLGTLTAGPNPGGVGVGDSGRILNSGIVENTLTVNNTANYTYNGVVERNVALTKTGTGTLALGGANTYVGPTVITTGTLVLTGSISGSRVIDVQSGATFDVTGVAGGFGLGAAQTLKGSGTVNGSIAVAGTLAPGSSPGTLTVSGASTFSSGSTFALEINGDTSFDKLVTNGVTLNGTANLTISLGYTPAINTQFLVVDNTSANPIAGFFTWSGPEGVLSEGEHFFVGAQEFSITYQGGAGGNDVILAAVPEPSAAVAMLGGIGVLALRRRKR